MAIVEWPQLNTAVSNSNRQPRLCKRRPCFDDPDPIEFTVQADSVQAESSSLLSTEPFALTLRGPRSSTSSNKGTNKENIPPLGFGRQTSQGFHALMKMR
jgi:hypothetical protein